jgi:hypothetical protein
MTPAEFVFGYGSLSGRGGVPATLAGHRRRWGVAMDNSRTIPGYKYYVEADSGARPDVHVAFLDIQPAPGESVNGVVLPVSPGDLTALDARERNYERIDVTDLIDPRPGGRVWTFAGSDDGRRRCRQADRLVVSRAYLEAVAAAFAALGPEQAARFRASTDEPPCPVDLRRVDL